MDGSKRQQDNIQEIIHENTYDTKNAGLPDPKFSAPKLRPQSTGSPQTKTAIVYITEIKEHKTKLDNKN